jgi:hypothetical protein
MPESLSVERPGVRFVPSFIGRHWKGEAPFWLSVLGWTLALTLSVYVISTLWLTQWSLQDTPVSRMIQGALVSSARGGRVRKRKRRRVGGQRDG